MKSHPTAVFSLAQAKALALRAQGLDREAAFGLGARGALSAIEHLSYVQIDTISVVERAHHHVIWSRVPDYSPKILHELMVQDRSVFEYWSHAAAYLPMRDFRFSLPRKKAYAEGKRHWFRHNRRVMNFVLDRIRAEGPLQAKDFEAPRGHKSSGWFDWKPAKIALEQLFMSGDLMIRERKGFQKVYDLGERVIPPGVDLRFPSPGEIARHWIENSLRAHGIATAQEMKYLRRDPKNELARALLEMEEEGLLSRAKVESLPGTYYCSRPASEPSKAAEVPLRILSPFDNLVIQRKRLKAFFDFDYQIECYTPAKKRKYGYFTLPILYGDALIGRWDAKAERQRKILKLISAHWSSELKDWEKSPLKLRETIEKSLDAFAAFNGCAGVSFPRTFYPSKSSIS